ncbi:acyl-CoA reductase [Thermaerobacillus caldiproteolyticus]|uniref:acyl-CoA reductase n=1 Tax=Thermaerobacillus caldiproteolyticus TaxID=247480 RepID=UPI00188BF9B2|nr:acyl-CoA reductase [Anoxybacillus caldiproteolyticus]QPA30693.1 acyl-CoA reductase [Anoxybacillus caldiproteolyticus]
MKFYWPTYSENWREVIDAILSTSPFTPFHPDVLSFLQNFSKMILKDHSYRRFPELIALAYWLRKSHLTEMKELFIKRIDGRIIRPRGVALHFSPSNVDTIFVYSWVLSMLAGNSNILRISSRQQEQTELLVKTIRKCLEMQEHQEVAKRTAIVTYEHNNQITQYLSERCHIRVIWGGDETVKAIRSIPLAPLATELAFPDRFSLSVIKASSVLEADDESFDKLIHHFYNDGFWFAQMACSSPRLITWIGDEEHIELAQQRFWSKLGDYLTYNQYDRSPALQVQKLATGYFLSSQEKTVTFHQQPYFSRLKITEIDSEIRERHCGGGLFMELELSQLEDLTAFLNDKDQTLSYFGFTYKELIDFVDKLKNRSIDRIVPIGQALNFEGVWDGLDLLMHFTREIVVR